MILLDQQAYVNGLSTWMKTKIPKVWSVFSYLHSADMERF
jgi:hypothetical protein